MTVPPPDVVLLKLPQREPEQFVMIDRHELFPTLPKGQPASREQWMDHFARLLEQPPLSEPAIREALLHRGLSSRAIDDLLAAARRKYEVMTSQPTSWEHITRIGYRNPDGQEIVRKTDIQAVHAFHHEVEQYQIGLGDEIPLERGHPILRLDDFVSGRLEDAPHPASRET